MAVGTGMNEVQGDERALHGCIMPGVENVYNTWYGYCML